MNSQTNNNPFPTLPAEGFVRLKHFLGPGKPVPISRSSWYLLVRAGKAPRPISMGPRTSVYSVASVRSFILSFSQNRPQE